MPQAAGAAERAERCRPPDEEGGRVQGDAKSRVAVVGGAGQAGAALLTSTRISISNIHKNTLPSFTDSIKYLYENKVYNGRTIVAKYLYDIVAHNRIKIDSAIDDSADYYIDYFGFKTLEKSYLLRSDGNIIERPQYLFMRVALAIHRRSIKDAIATYKLLSQK